MLIYGAGNAGENLLRSIELAADIHIHVVGFIDDDPVKFGNTLRNCRVLGGRLQIAELARRHDISDIYIAIPSLSGKQFRDLLDAVHAQVGDRVRIHTLPGIVHFANGRVSIEQMRKVEIGDLLRRSPVHLDHEPVRRLIRGQVVMVVGGGGSIGSELCKQIAGLEPAQLLVIDSSEFNTYQIDAELQRLFPYVPVTCLVADAGNMPIMHRIFAEYRPGYVFHAAAYKHVPLMEAHPWAAVVNNLACTLTLTELAGLFRVKRFVLVSSDKAVRPTNVMGATKRICEDPHAYAEPHQHHGFPRRAIRQRAGQFGERDPQVRAADCGGRAGDGDTPRYYALFHAHSRGGGTGAAGGGRGRARQYLRAGYG